MQQQGGQGQPSQDQEDQQNGQQGEQQQNNQQDGQQSRGQRQRRENDSPQFVPQPDENQQPSADRKPGDQQQQPSGTKDQPLGGQDSKDGGKNTRGNKPPNSPTGKGQPGTGAASWGDLQPYLNFLRNRGASPQVPEKYRKYYEAYLKNKVKGRKK